MSKRDIETVCTLAAHLAQVNKPGSERNGLFCAWDAPRCAADAMRLQQLGRSARNLLKSDADDQREMIWLQRISDQSREILLPYGLGAVVDYDTEPHYFIIGLPGNTGGGDQEGFGI